MGASAAATGTVVSSTATGAAAFSPVTVPLFQIGHHLSSVEDPVVRRPLFLLLSLDEAVLLTA